MRNDKAKFIASDLIFQKTDVVELEKVSQVCSLTSDFKARHVLSSCIQGTPNQPSFKVQTDSYEQGNKDLSVVHRHLDTFVSKFQVNF